MRMPFRKPGPSHPEKSLKSTKPGRPRRGKSHQPSLILRLQRAVGNRSVRGLLDAKAPVPGPVRRQSILSSENLRAVWPAGSNAVIQPKLNVSTPGDACEREADRIAEQMVRGDGAKPERSKTLASPKQVSGQNGATPTFSRAPHISLTGGVPLARSERTYFEPRFGLSLENVRIHGGVEADASARSLHARAFTLGNDIWFAQGEYRPGSRDGRRLLAHELTHTIQQSQLARPLIQREAGQPLAGPRRVAAPARAQAVEALDRAIERLAETIKRTARGEEVPEDVHSALERFFPGETPDFVPLLLRRVVAVRSIIETIRIRAVFTPVDVSIEPEGIEINQILATGTPLTPMPPSAPTYILVFPRFYRERNLQATRLIHECFHVRYPSFIRHSETSRGRENPRANAFAYQGFVGMIGGLPQVRPLELFPAPE